jgi:hypothetical protein
MRDKAVVQIPVTLDSANRRKDRSVSLRFSSTQELGTADFAELDRLTPSSGWLLFAQNEFDEGDVPHEDAPDDGKRPSQRLRAVLFIWWHQNTDQSEPFQRFYERWMEKRINSIKEELSRPLQENSSSR